MFRRVALTPSLALARSTARRTYFYPGGGEVGISGASMKFAVNIIYGAIFLSVIFVYKVIFGYYSPKKQWLFEATDLYTDDGTVMEGPEAVANLKIYYERIMPYMEQIKTKLDEAEGH